MNRPKGKQTVRNTYLRISMKIQGTNSPVEKHSPNMNKALGLSPMPQIIYENLVSGT